MARLILEEGGQRRAFKVGEGRLTIGSGSGCALQLASPNVAETHAELEFTGGFAFLRPRPGVMPPLIHGQPITQQTPLADGARFEIGAARFQFLVGETDSSSPGRAAGTPPAASKVPPPAGGILPPAPVATRPRAGARRTAAAETPGVQRTRARVQVKRGIPTWLMLVLIAGAVLIAFFVVRDFVGRAGESAVVISATLDRAQQRFVAREFDAARSALALIPRDRATPDELRRLESLERQMDEIERRGAIDRQHQREAERYRETQLVRFQRDRLAGDNPPRERVRVYLKRLAEFRQLWPDYPDMEWIDRQERLYSRLVDLSEPPTLADVAFEVQSLTWARPRHYRQAADLVRSFAETASGSDRQQALELLDKLDREEEEYFDDRMQQAKYHWNRGESGQSVGELIWLILGLDDPERVDQAAQELIDLPGFDQFLRGYRRESPARYDELVTHPRVRAAARRAGLLQ